MNRINLYLVLVFLIILSTVIIYYESQLIVVNNIATIRKDKIFKIYEYNKDVIADKQTAINVAKSILVPIYENNILKETNFDGFLYSDSIWFIAVQSNKKGYSSGYVIELQKKDSKVLTIYKSK